MQQRPLFHEDINDALKTLIAALGGAKKVGLRLWPEKTMEAAQQLLLACLNSERKEHLTPEQMILLLAMGRELGCHAAMEYFAEAAGYEKPRAVEPADKQAELLREFNKSVEHLNRTLQQLQASGVQIPAPALKAVP